ncbi:MAG: hypothetical protein CMM50_00030 [Rhodospirillaceae bacterium]|nr:hypothetical protein [Rhodospirillaceae bacterium]
MTLVVFIALSRHAIGHPAEKQTTNLYFTFKAGVRVKNKMFHLRGFFDWNCFPSLTEFLGVVHRVVLALS